ncbi:MAG: GTP cyclohydrolase I FolE [Chloroflexi bacterium]|nr:GTP cyclohydrolase I FolE [Chloroflexota bacterium]
MGSVDRAVRIAETVAPGRQLPRPLELNPIARLRIERAVREILDALGEDPEREGLRDTPRRVASMYAELFAGLNHDPAEVLGVTFAEDHHEMVILSDIPVYSLCEHHLLPFRGVAHIGYIPDGHVVGVSKLARLVELLARRPQLQERLTSQVADAIESRLSALGVGVVIEAEHSCTTIRGVRATGSKMITSAMRGAFRDNLATRSEFLALIGVRV